MNMNVYNRIYIIVHIFELSFESQNIYLKLGELEVPSTKISPKHLKKNKSRPTDKMCIQHLLVFGADSCI